MNNDSWESLRHLIINVIKKLRAIKIRAKATIIATILTIMLYS